MASKAKDSLLAAEDKVDVELPTQPACGLIMPISATDNHDEKHWASVQILLHRAIRSAGLTPANVWEGVNDRISKRIVSNIFRQDIVVADISDLNPNVMLELGLRLASKKPTVIVFNKDGKIPFDIADVEAIDYPSDLNIIEMEVFFEKFSNLLKSRLNAYKAGTYEPYLGDVVVEVLEPQTKEVSVEDLVLERLDELGTRMSRIERNTNRNGRERNHLGASKQSGNSNEAYIYAWVPYWLNVEFNTSIRSIASKIVEHTLDGKSYFKLYIPRDVTVDNFVDRLNTRLPAFGGGLGASDDARSILDLLG